MTSLRHNDESSPGPRDAYLDAARACILDVGWRRTTLTEVARRAGVSRMTIYRSWADMPTLLGDLMTREWTGLVATTVGTSTADDALTRLVDDVVATIRALRENELFVRIVELDPELVLPYLLSRRGRSQDLILGLLTEALREGQAAGSVRAGDRQLLVFLSRTHYYEGKGVEAVVHGVRTAAAAGCRAIVLTNGCGGLKESWTPGTPVLISDHINLTGRSPIVGARFVDLTDLYSARLRAMCREVEPSLDEGVYVQFPGPHYETPAEVRMAGVLGGHLVGMSTTLEAIAAREAGMEVLGISLVTNLAAGISDQPLDHSEVIEAGRAAASRMGDLLSRVVPRI